MNANAVDQKINLYGGKVDAFLLKWIDFIGNRPWKAWLDVANRMVTKYIPVAVAVVGILACVTSLVTAIKMDARFSTVMQGFWLLIPVLFSIHLAPKAMALVRSLVEKGEELKIRPELLYIMKVLLGLGGIVLAIYLFFQAEFVPGIAVLVFACLSIIFLSCPEIAQTKEGYPTNSVEEIISIVLFLIRILLALVTVLIGLGVIGGFIYGIIMWFDNGMEAAGAFGLAAILPFALPLALYFYYLFMVILLDLCRAIVSIPGKLDAIIKK